MAMCISRARESLRSLACFFSYKKMKECSIYTSIVIIYKPIYIYRERDYIRASIEILLINVSDHYVHVD